jgi:hypothetical protein
MPHKHIDKRASFYDKCFKDSEGAIVLTQRVNLPLIVWLVGVFTAYAFNQTGMFDRTLRIIAFGAIFTWGWMELFQGINYFRRVLGLCTLITCIVAMLAHNIYLNYLI